MEHLLLGVGYSQLVPFRARGGLEVEVSVQQIVLRADPVEAQLRGGEIGQVT